MKTPSFITLSLFVVLSLLLSVGGTPATAKKTQLPRPDWVPVPQTSLDETDATEVGATNGSSPPSVVLPADRARVSAELQSTSVMFIENVGQFAEGARFQAHGGDRTIWLAEEAVWITVLEKPGKGTEGQGDGEAFATPIRNHKSKIENRKGVNLKLSFPGANPHPRLEPFNRLDTHISYFIGNDPDRWRTNAPVWGGVRYVDLYPGIDLELTGESGQIVQRLVVRDGAISPTARRPSLADVRLRVEGADQVALDSDRLRLTSAAGEFSLPLLHTSTVADVSLGPMRESERGVYEITTPFAAISNRQTRIPNSPLDASDLLYSTFLGGSSYDDGTGIAIDASGAAYLTGETWSSDFPTTPGAFDPSHNGGYDAFVVKLSVAGSTLTYATFLGGSTDDTGFDIAVDGNGAAYVTGYTRSSDFPTTPGAFDTSFNGGTYDAFAVKLNATGSALAYATFLGGSAMDHGYGIAVDASGAAYVTGDSFSSDFPTTSGAFDPSYNGNDDAFVMKLNTAGSALTCATFLGGSSEDRGYDIAIDSSGAVYVTGGTWSSDFPTTAGAFDPSYNGGSYDAFAVKLNATGSTLTYATFLGGSDNEWGDGIAIDASGAAYLTGYTKSSDFPTTPGAFDPSHNGYSDVFVVKLNAAGSTLVYVTFLGGSTDDVGYRIAVDGNGGAYITGDTTSSDFPTTPGAFDTGFNGGTYDAFVVKLNATGSALAYATFLGGSDWDMGYGIAINASGAAYVTGWTRSSDFPTTLGAFDTTYNGNDDAFVVKLLLGEATTTYSISGHVLESSGNPIPDVTISAGAGSSGTTDASGAYTITNLITATYTLTPTRIGWTFTPGNRTVSIPPNAAGQDFTGSEEATALRITAFPNSIPADGAATVTVTLFNAPVGHQVRFLSSRGSVDAFANSSSIASTNGQFSTTIRSATPGVAILTAQDLTTDQTFATLANVTFTPVGGGPPPPLPNTGPVAITGIHAEHPLDARYLEGIPVPNRINVTVDWKGTTPGRVDYILNSVTYSEPAGASGASHTLDMGYDLRRGSNSLRIVAYNAAGQASNPQDFSPFSVPAPVWLTGLQQAGLMSLPVLASGDWSGKASYQVGFHLPNEPFSIKALHFGVPDADTKLEWSIDGQLEIPLDCTTALEASLSAGVGGFKFLGTEIGIEGSGGLRADRMEVCAFELPHGFAGMKVEAERNIYRKPVLVMVTYFNAAVGATVDQIVVILHIEEFVGKLGEFYIDGKAHFDAETQVAFANQAPYFQFQDLELGGGLGIEGGFRADLAVVEVKVWAGADGSIKFVRMGPVTWPPADNWEFDSITLSGEMGAKFRVGWFVQEAKGEIAWTYPPAGRAIAAVPNDLTISDWRLIGHNAAQDYATFRAMPGRQQAFASAMAGLQPADLTAQATVTSVLVSNVYTYPEPALAVNPATDHALLLWVHDDIAKPVGQAQEIESSRWNGSSWSVPAGVTNDNLLDGAPQVAWTGDGQAVAVWQRLNDTLPITATWDVTTANKIEIATSMYSPTTGAWSPVTLLTNNLALDMTPRLARNASGQLLAVWRQNPAGLLGGDADHPDRIMAAFYNNGMWSTPTMAVDGIPGLVDLAVGYGNNAAAIAYTRYLTPTGYPTPTLQLFISRWYGSTWSTPEKLTDDSLGNRNPQVVFNSHNFCILVWLAGNKLRLSNLSSGYLTVLMLEDSKIIDEFRLVQNAADNLAAVFTAQTEQRDLFVAFYDQAYGSWGRPMPLTSDQVSEAYPAAALDSTGRLLMGYAATAISSITHTTTISGTGQVVTYTLPTEGQTDLLTLSHEFTRNLTLDSLRISTDRPAPGETVVLSATVRNSGDVRVDNVTVGFYDGDPLGGGTLVKNVTLSYPLVSGFTATLTTAYTVPITGGAHLLYAVADPAYIIAESNEADNTAMLAAFGPDLEIASAGVDYWGGSDVGLVTLVRNVGTNDASTTTLAFYRDALTGTLAVTDTLPLLAAGQAVTLTTPWNFGPLSTGAYPLVAVVNRGEFTETFTANNAFTFTLDVRPDLMVSPYYLWTSSPTGTTVLVTATVYSIGVITATDIVVGFYGDDRLEGGSALFTRTIQVLGPAGSTTLSGQVNGPLACTLYAYIDPGRTITETTRGNNLAGISYRGLCQRVYLPVVLRNP